MTQKANDRIAVLAQARDKIRVKLEQDGVVILAPMDVEISASLLAMLGIKAQSTVFDPWYNKGVGGERDDYDDYIVRLLTCLGPISDHVFFWGFPEIAARFVGRIPAPLSLRSWVTWYYKNSPSMIRGWRSAQMACLHLSQADSRVYVENFLNDIQLEKLKAGKLRYMPGPPSVIEESLLCGFVGKKEQTGHPSQKPVAVIEKIIRMGTTTGDLVIDLMSGAGTSAAAARNLGRYAIICDISDEYTKIAEKRLSVQRMSLPKKLIVDATSSKSALPIERFNLPVLDPETTRMKSIVGDSQLRFTING